MKTHLFSHFRFAVRFGLFLTATGVWAATNPSAASPAAAVPNPAKPEEPVSQAQSYTFAVTDALTVAVYGEDDLNSTTRVDTTGCINLKLVGTVRIVGLTISEAEKAVENAYIKGRFLRKPQVTINIQTTADREVIVQGQIKAPGRIPLPIETTMNVVELISRAGGFTDIAKGNAVRITHYDREGKPHITTVDVQAIIDGRSKLKPNDPSLLLQPGDVVYVDETLF